MIVEIADQCRPPRIAALRVAQCVELQRHAVIYAQFLQQLVRHHEQFDIRRRFCRADNLRINLVKLTIAALLRAFVTEQWAVHRQLHRRKLLPAIGEIGARNARRKFGPQRDRIPAAIFEAVHFLGYDIRRLTQAARKYGRWLNHRQLQALKSIKPAHAFKCCDNMRKTFFCLAEHVLSTANGLGCLYLCHIKAP